MRRLLVSTLVLLTLACGAAFAQPFSSVEERMTTAEFKAAGLDKLSPEELAQLNAWLSREVGRTAAPGAPAEDRRGFAGTGQDLSDIDTRIAGEFTGWAGRGARFVLSNGQIWESVDSTSSLRGVKLDSPRVTIESGAFGSWYLSVEGYNTRARVRRVK